MILKYRFDAYGTYLQHNEQIMYVNHFCLKRTQFQLMLKQEQRK